MRKVLISMAFMALVTSDLSAQVFLTGNDLGSNRAQTEENILAVQQSEQQDRFTPLGSGTLILAALGGAFLFTRKKQQMGK